MRYFKIALVINCTNWSVVLPILGEKKILVKFRPGIHCSDVTNKRMREEFTPCGPGPCDRLYHIKERPNYTPYPDAPLCIGCHANEELSNRQIDLVSRLTGPISASISQKLKLWQGMYGINQGKIKRRARRARGFCGKSRGWLRPCPADKHALRPHRARVRACPLRPPDGRPHPRSP